VREFCEETGIGGHDMTVIDEIPIHIAHLLGAVS